MGHGRQKDGFPGTEEHPQITDRLLLGAIAGYFDIST